VIDRLTPTARLALEPQRVLPPQQPDWGFELMTVLALALIFVGLVMLSSIPDFDKAARDSAEVADFYKRRAEAGPAPEPMALVRIVREGEGFDCSFQNVRREWELAVAAECRTLGQLLLYARTTK
jgi:hypothetical protein